MEELHKSELVDEIPDVIFVDLSVPVMIGWEFLEKLDGTEFLKNKPMKIVLVSSSIDPREIELLKQYPMVSKYVVKQITPADLEAISNC